MGEEARRGEQPHQTLLAEILLAPLAHTAQEAEVAVAAPLVAELLYVESERASLSLRRSTAVCRVAEGSTTSQGPPG